MTKATQEATLTRRYRSTATADQRGAMTLLRLLGQSGRPQFFAQLKANPVPPGGTVHVRVTHESPRCNVLTEGFACTCRHPIVVVEAIHPPGAAPGKETTMSKETTPFPPSFLRAREHFLRGMMNLVDCLRGVPDHEPALLDGLRQSLHSVVHVVSNMYPAAVATAAWEHVLPPERLEAWRAGTLSWDGWDLELGAEKLGHWLHAHGQTTPPRGDA